MVETPDDPIDYEAAMSTMALEPDVAGATRGLSDAALLATREHCERFAGGLDDESAAGWFSALATLLLRERVRRQVEARVVQFRRHDG